MQEQPETSSGTNGDARIFEVALGEETIRCRLPIIPRRDVILVEYERIAPNLLASQDRLDGPSWEFGLLCAAALGVCWAGEPLGCPSLAACGYVVCEYGEGVLDALCAAGHSPRHISRAGRACINRLAESMPIDEAIKEAADPT